jgi:O-antigen/teichoic acid export membrane protein
MKPISLIGQMLNVGRTSKKRALGFFQISLYRNALYLVMSFGVNALLGFVFWILATRFYSAEDVGLASAAISAVALLALLSGLGFDYGLIRFLPTSGEKSAAMLNTCLTISGLLSVIAALVFIAGLGIWSPVLLFLRQTPILIAAVVVFVAARTLYASLAGVFIAGRRSGYALAQNIVLYLIMLVTVITLASHTRLGIFAASGIGFLVAFLVSLSLFLPLVQQGYRPFLTIKRKVLDEIMPFSLANYLSALLWTAPGFILPLMVVNLLGAEPNAYFYVAWAIGSILSGVPQAVALSLFAEGSYDGRQLNRDTIRSLWFTGFLLLPLIVIIFLVGNKLLLLFGQAYSEKATSLLWILAVSTLPLSLNYIYFSRKRVERKMRSVIVLMAFVAVATLGLSYLLMPRMGILGVGVAWLSSQVIGSLMIVCKLWR